MSYEPYGHLHLHATRSAELHLQAPLRATRIRVRLGWWLVEAGLRLATPPRVAHS